MLQRYPVRVVRSTTPDNLEVTTVFVTVGNVEYSGTMVCAPNDRFNRKVAVIGCISRALRDRVPEDLISQYIISYLSR